MSYNAKKETYKTSMVTAKKLNTKKATIFVSYFNLEKSLDKLLVCSNN